MNPGTTTTVWPNSAVRTRRLNIGGLDVLNDYAGNTTGFSVPLETIALTEEGPGGVSSLAFTIWDPNIEVTLSTGQDVEFWDIARDRPLFAGFIQALDIVPAEGPGRWLHIDCIGLEALLDWIMVPYCVIHAGTWLATALQSLVYNASGIGWPIRAFTQPSGSEDYGSQAYPIAGIYPGFPEVSYDITFEGQSLREACNQVIAACNTWAGGSGGGYVTIDFYSGLRFLNGNGPGDEGILTMSAQSDMDYMFIQNDITTAYPILAGTTTDFRLDAGGVTRAVYIVGGIARTTGQTPIGSGLVSDGSGIPGPVAYINDPTSTTTDIRNAIGAAYLGGFSQVTRATVSFRMPDENIDNYNYRPGSYLWFLTDTQVMGTDTLFTLFRIRKTFRGADIEEWAVDFGGLAPSGENQLRRLTRDTRS